MNDKTTEALTLSDEVLKGIELETLSTQSACLRCLRLARLMDDNDSMQWLQYESTGYPKAPGQKKVETKAFFIAHVRGRRRVGSEPDDNQPYIFSETASELEAIVQATTAVSGSMTTQGVSVEGQYAAISMNSLTRSVTGHVKSTKNALKDANGKLAILRGMYYSYALKVNYQLKFGNRSEDLFKSYRTKVDKAFLKFAPESLNKLSLAFEHLTSENPESWAQALTSCRRVFLEVADSLFEQFLPELKDKTAYKTSSGKELSVDGERYLNRLFAVVDKIVSSGTSLRLQESHIRYIVEYIESLHDLLCKGVHDAVTLDQARFAILHTYLTLGDLSTQIPEKAY